MKKFASIILLTIAGVMMAHASDVVLQGKVIAADDGEPLIGATVVVTSKELKRAGSARINVSAMTDVDGNFTISGPTQVARRTGDPRWLP